MTSIFHDSQKRHDLLKERAIVEKVLVNILDPIGFRPGRLLPFALVGYSLGPGYRHEFSNLSLGEVLVIKAPSHSHLTSPYRSQIWREAVRTPLGDKKWRDLRHLKQNLEDWLLGQREVLNLEIDRRRSLLLSPQDITTTLESLDWVLAKRGYLYDSLLSRQHIKGNGRIYSRLDIKESISSHVVADRKIRLIWYKTDFAEKIGETYLKAESIPKTFVTVRAVDEDLEAWLTDSRENNTIIKLRSRKIRDDSSEGQNAMLRLRRLVGTRVSIGAIIDRISWKNGWNGFVRRLILLSNVMDKEGNLLGNNFWVNDCKQFQNLDIDVGDEIELTIKVERISLERIGPPDPLKEVNEETDKVGYRLTRPNKVKITKKTKSSIAWR